MKANTPLESGSIVKISGRFLAINGNELELTSGKTLKSCKENLFLWCFSTHSNRAFVVRYKVKDKITSFEVFGKGK